jgi:hypothetical protein
MPTDLFLATATEYTGFREALRARAEQLNISRQTLDCETGLADGYCSKVLSPKSMKGVITQTALEPVLTALRLRLILIDDQEVASRRGDLPQRDVSQVRLNNDARRNNGRKAQSSAKPRKAAKPKRGKPYLSR